MKRNRLVSTATFALAAAMVPVVAASGESPTLRVRPPAAAPSDIGESAVTPGGTLSGRLVDLDGEPVSGGRVRLFRLAEPEGRDGVPLADGDLDADAEATAGADGRFLFPHLAAGRYELRAGHVRRATRVLPPFEVTDGRTLDLGTIELSPGGALAGRVVGPDGRPVARAWLTVQATSASASVAALPLRVDGISDCAGRFEVSGLPAAEPLRLTVRASGYAEAEVAGLVVPREEPLVVELRQGSRIFGSVVGPGGEPVANAQIDAGTIGSPADTGSHGFGSASTGADGSFEVAGLGAGALTVAVRADGYPRRIVDGLTIAEDETLGPIEIRLDAGTEVTGRVLAPDGSPAPDAGLWLVPSSSGSGTEHDLAPLPPGMPASAAEVLSDARGEFVIRGAEIGPVTVVARHDRLGSATAEVELRPGTNTVELILDRRGEVQGRVVDGAGEAVRGAEVDLTTEDGARRATWSARTDARGRFAFRAMAPGTYRLEASGPGLYLGGPPVAVTVGERPPVDLELVLIPGEEVVGRLLGVPDRELVHLDVDAFRQGAGGSSHRSASPGPDGRFRLTGLAPGLWSVHASSPSGRSARADVEVGAGGGPYALDLDLGGGLTLTGSLRVEGEPLGRASIRLLGLDVAHDVSVGTALNGTFLAGGLEPGRYEVMVTAGRSALGRVELVLAADDELHLDLPVASLSGRVLDAAGDPVPGADVLVDVPPGERGFGGMATTDAAGRFAIPRLAPGRYTVVAGRLQGPSAVAELSLESGDDRELELRLAEGHELVVTAVTSSGEPPDRLRLEVFQPGGIVVWAGEAPVSGDGMAAFSGVPAGEWMVGVSADGTAIGATTTNVPGPGFALTLPPSTELQIEAPSLAELAMVPFTVVGPDGREPAAAALAEAVGGLWLHRGQTALSQLPPGTWTVRVTAPGGRVLEGTADTAPDRPAVLVLQ